jgi:AcrR family transcriptional regulator
MVLPVKTQARSIETRGRLLEATVRCLVERGYQGTSTAEVCRQAGVSKGALLHHYPTRAQLVAAAVEHLFQLRLAEFRDTVGASGAPPGERELDAVFAKLWEIYSGPTLGAWLELVVAARTDAELRKAVAGVDGRFACEAQAVFAEVFGVDDEGLARAGVRMLMGFFDGMAVHRVLEPDASRVAETLGLFRNLMAAWLGRSGGRT